MQIKIKVSPQKTLLLFEENNKILRKKTLNNHNLFEELLPSINSLAKSLKLQSLPKINVICNQDTNNLSCNIAKTVAKALNL